MFCRLSSGRCPADKNIYKWFITEGNIVTRCVFSAVRDGTSSQCEVPRDPHYPECPGKVDVSVNQFFFIKTGQPFCTYTVIHLFICFMNNCVQWMRARWTSDPCYAFYGVDGSDCSFLIYLSEVEWFCPPLAWRNHSSPPTQHTQPAKAPKRQVRRPHTNMHNTRKSTTTIDLTMEISDVHVDIFGNRQGKWRLPVRQKGYLEDTHLSSMYSIRK